MGQFRVVLLRLADRRECYRLESFHSIVERAIRVLLWCRFRGQKVKKEIPSKTVLMQIHS